MHRSIFKLCFRVKRDRINDFIVEELQKSEKLRYQFNGYRKMLSSVKIHVELLVSALAF